MVWAMILQAGEKYLPEISKTVHLTMASLDTMLADNQPVQVTMVIKDVKYLLCTLHKDSGIWQVPLNIILDKETAVTFICNGSGFVHLTGYYKDEISVKNVCLVKVLREMKKTLFQEVKQRDEKLTQKIAELLKKLQEKIQNGQEANERRALKRKISLKNRELYKGLAANFQDDNDSDDFSLWETEQQIEFEIKDVICGVQIQDLKIGTGRAAQDGDYIKIYYVARVLRDFKRPKIDECRSGLGLVVHLGNMTVLPGLELGIMGMKVGGKRRLIISPEMAYGAEGYGSKVLPNSTLIYVVELIKISDSLQALNAEENSELVTNSIECTSSQ